MTTRPRKTVAVVLTMAVAMLTLLAPTAQAQPAVYPAKSVKIVVPFPAGGSNDVIARLLAQKLSDKLGQPFVVDNRGGAGGNIGADMVAKAEPDGYTLLLTASPPLTSNVALYETMPFNPVTAFAPVALVASVPIVLVVHPSMGATGVRDVIAKAKARPGTLNFGSSGKGSTNHLAGELLKSRANIDIVHVPYKGAAPALNDLLSGHIPMMFDNLPALVPHIRSKAIIPVAVAGAERVKALPDVPTVAEAAGLPGFSASAWFGLVAPARTPAPVLARLQAGVEAALKDPDLRTRFEALGADPGALFGEGFRAFLQEESVKWEKTIKAAGLKAD